jgi:transposase
MNTTVASYWRKIQSTLFPGFAEELGSTTDKHLKVILVLDIVKLEDHLDIDPYPLGPGRPRLDATAMARAFVAKAVLNIPTTRALIDRLNADAVLRRICGFERKAHVPCEASFSNWFARFARISFPEKVHEALVREAHQGVPVHNVSRDSTAIDAREKPATKQLKMAKIPKKRGRPMKGESRPDPEPTRLERQQTMSLSEQIADLPNSCDHGFKTNAKGISTGWIGYKLHIDTAQGAVPVACVLTSASVHDSAVALPLESMTTARINSLYTLMDAAYDASIIRENTEKLGKVAVIDSNPRRGEKVEFDPPRKLRFKCRTEAERINSNLKDDYGGRYVRVRGAAKVLNHLMFGILALTAVRLAMLGS